VIPAGLYGGSGTLMGDESSPKERVAELQPVFQTPTAELFDSPDIIDNTMDIESRGSENWGNIGRGVHARELSIPERTLFVHGHVQEASNYACATYQTLGIAINRSAWRCRVYWRMNLGVRPYPGGSLSVGSFLMNFC